MPENNNTFNHIKIHTQYSICEGALKIEDLKNYCKVKISQIRIILQFKKFNELSLKLKTPISRGLTLTDLTKSRAQI